MFRFKGIGPFLDDFLDVLRDFLDRLNELKVRYLELLEFLAGIAEVLARPVVKLHQRSGLCINEHNRICRLLKDSAVSFLRLAQRLLRPLVLGFCCFQFGNSLAQFCQLIYELFFGLVFVFHNRAPPETGSTFR